MSMIISPLNFMLALIILDLTHPASSKLKLALKIPFLLWGHDFLMRCAEGRRE